MGATVSRPGQIPGKPALDRAGGEIAALGPCARSGNRVEQPGELRGREVRLDRQPGETAHACLRATGDELRAPVGRARVLPDDRVCNRDARGALPDDDRLALVCDSDPGHAVEVDLRQDVASARGDRLEDLERIVLDESRLRVVLAVWQLPLGDAVAGQIDERRPARGRALIEGEDEIGGHGLSMVDTADGTGFERSQATCDRHASQVVGLTYAAPVRDLRPLFDPRSVAVLGASDDPTKWGQWIAAGALRGAHRRDVWLVNRKGGQILGREAYTSLAELPGEPDLVVISLPEFAFEQAIDDSLAAGAKAIVAITAGLGEIDDAGKAREVAVVERVRAAGAVMVGPNCLGVYDAAAELDVGSNSFAPGSIGIISQSGNLALELSLLAAEYGVGVSRFTSLGNQADIEAAELVESYAADEHTRVIGVYCEDFRDGRAFARAGAAAVAAGKQVVLLAAGGSEAGARAAASHTGALASDSAAVEAACRAAKILRVATPKELIDRALASLSPHRPRGRKVAIVGDGGGTGVVTADLVTEAGLDLPELSDGLKARLIEIAPTIITANPVDLAGAGEVDFWNFEKVLKAVLDSGEVDSVVFTGYFGGYSEMNPDFAPKETEVAAAIAAAAARAGGRC